MPTGKGNKAAAANRQPGAAAAAPRGLRFDGDRMVVLLDNERELSLPLTRYPSLRSATPAQREAWEMIGPAKGFHWPALDLDLSVDGLLAGLPEAIPRPPMPRPRRLAARPPRARPAASR